MGRKCNVLDCPSDSKRSEDNGVTFHKMPFHQDLRPKWIELCRIPEDRQLIKVIYVCSRHFRRTDFCNFKGTKYMLKQGALPSVFPWTRCLIKLPNGNKSDEGTNADEPDIKLEPMDTDSKSNDELDIPQIKEEPVDEEIIEVKEEPIIEEEKSVKIKKESDSVSTVVSKPRSKKEKKEVSVKKESDASSIPPRIKEETPICISFFPGTRIEANDFNDKWYPASILEVDYEENEVFVEFDKNLNRANEWIPMDSSRLRPYVGASTADFVVGEKCMATWSNSCSKFPATIKKVLDGDNYEVLFDDGFTKVLKHCKLSKIKDRNNIPLPPKAPVPHAAPLFEPVVGSKEDRRERKRKLNVAQLFSRKRPKSDDYYDDEKYDLPEINKTLPPLAYGDGEEWTCRWLNGEPIGLESTLESPDGTRRSIIVPDHRLPPGWEKHLTQRLYGNSAGKWDSILVNPDGKKFANRQQLKIWFEEHKLEYNIENFDFSLHINRAKKLGLYEITDPELTAANLKPNQQQKPNFPKLKGSKSHSKLNSSKNANLAHSPATPEIPVLEPEVEEENNPEASLKIIHENDSYKCPIEGCGKNFRKENLAQMHIKHYHPEYSKLIGSTPNVADLAYARTVGEHIDEIVPPKLKAVSSPLFEKDKPFKTESSSFTSSTSKPKSTIKVLTPKTSHKDKDDIIKSGIPHSPGISKGGNSAKDSEIIRLLNSEPKTKMDSIFDSVEIHKQLGPDESSISSPDKYPEIKLRDLLNKSEPVPYKKDEFNNTSNRSYGIKTLLPVNRNQHQNDDNKIESDTDLIKPIERNKPGRKKSADKRRQSFKYDTDDMSDYYYEADSHSQDSFIKAAVKPPPPQLLPPAEVIAAPPAQEGQVIIEGGEVIRLVHMRSEEIINCTCGITEEDGLMIQCELCLCWQHAHCNNIRKENEVPDKYICKICKNPQRMRQSKKYMHDQDWLKQGVLAAANYHSKDPKVLEKRFEMLRKSHELSGCMLELKEYLHNLRVKLNIAGGKDHPKLYLWAKQWDKPFPDNTLNLQKPDMKDDDIKEESFNRSFASSDHSYIKSTTAFSEMALKTMLEPLEDLKNEIENPDLDMDIKLPVDTKIKSQSELISILEDDEPSTSTTDVNKLDSSFPKIDLNSIIVNNLTDKIDTKNDVLNKEEALNSITSGILSSTSLDLALAQLSSVVAAPDVVGPPHHHHHHLHIPQPEAVIDSSDCKLNLLDHVSHYQSLVEERLNSVEAALFELEGEDSNPLPDDDDYDSRTKQTLQMLVRDLGTMREIAALNN